jgi:hypothetical protein
MSAYTHGSATFASSGVTQGSARLVFDQRGGNTWEYTYEGTATGIAAQAAALQAAGARTSIDNSGPIHRLVASFVRDPNESTSAEVAFDVWNIENEEYQVSVFATTRAIEEAGSYTNRALYRSDIEEAVRNGEAYPLSASEFPVGQYIYNLLTQGIDTQPQKLPVISRNRTYSLTYTGTPHRVTVTPVVYTRAALIADFGIVSPLLDRIPPDPSITLPEGFVWGWYLARESFSYQIERGALKVTENLGWRFGAWNAWPAGSAIQGLYTLIT